MHGTFTVDLCKADGYIIVLPVKRHQCSKCRVTGYCSKACQVASWPNHKKLCGKKECRAAIKHEVIDHGVYMYNVVIKLYNEAA